MEALGKALWSIAGDPPQPGRGEKGLIGEPATAALADELVRDKSDLLPNLILRQRHEKVRVTQVAVVLRNLESEDKMITERLMRQVGDELVILMRIASPMRENH